MKPSDHREGIRVTFEFFGEDAEQIKHIAMRSMHVDGKSPNPNSEQAAGAGSQASNLLAKWLKLTPYQRSILEFVRRNESKLLNFALISQYLAVPGLPGSPRFEPGVGRMIDETTVARECKPMIDDQLLVRKGPRSPIQITELGVAVLNAGKSGEQPLRSA